MVQFSYWSHSANIHSITDPFKWHQTQHVIILIVVDYDCKHILNILLGKKGDTWFTRCTDPVFICFCLFFSPRESEICKSNVMLFEVKFSCEMAQ